MNSLSGLNPLATPRELIELRCQVKQLREDTNALKSRKAKAEARIKEYEACEEKPKNEAAKLKEIIVRQRSQLGIEALPGSGAAAVADRLWPSEDRLRTHVEKLRREEPSLLPWGHMVNHI